MVWWYVSKPTSSRSLCLPPARMHFCVSAARAGWYGHGAWPRKMGTNWFMPALVKSKLGESGSRELEGTMVCCFSLKKSRKDWRISEEVMGDYGFRTEGERGD